MKNRFRTSLVLSLVLLVSMTSVGVNAAGRSELISLDVMRKATVGSFKGAFTNCRLKRGIELNFREQPGDGQSLGLSGALKIFDLPGAASSGAQQISADLVGTQLADSGYVTLRAQPPKPGSKGLSPTNPLSIWKEKLGVKDAPPPSVLRVNLGFIRDFEGSGYTGLLLIPNFECNSFTLSRTDGSGSGILPLPDVQFIYGQAALLTPFILEEPPFNGKMGISPSHHESPIMTSPIFYDVPWLLYADKLGHPTALAEVGRIYEFALGVPLDYSEALRIYTMAAEKGNAAAQAGLGRLYGSGLGVDKDVARSKQFSQQYNATRVAAMKLCVKPPVMHVVTELIYQGMREPPPMTVATLLGQMATADQKIDVGNEFVYQSVSAVDLANVDKPFYCKYKVKLVDPKVTDMTPYTRWKITDPTGRVYYTDNADDIANNQAMASLTTELAKAIPMMEVMQIWPLGGSKYRVSRIQETIGGLQPSSTVEVDLAGSP